MAEPTFELIEVEDWDTDEPMELKQFYVTHYLQSAKKDCFSTQEEAEQEALKQLKSNPWGAERYIVEVKKYIKAIPDGNVQFKSIDVQKYSEQKLLNQEDTAGTDNASI